MFKISSSHNLLYGCENICINPSGQKVAIHGKKALVYDIMIIYKNYKNYPASPQIIHIHKGKINGFINDDEIEFLRPNKIYQEYFTYSRDPWYDIFIYNTSNKQERKVQTSVYRPQVDISDNQSILNNHYYTCYEHNIMVANKNYEWAIFNNYFNRILLTYPYTFETIKIKHKEININNNIIAYPNNTTIVKDYITEFSIYPKYEEMTVMTVTKKSYKQTEYVSHVFEFPTMIRVLTAHIQSKYNKSAISEGCVATITKQNLLSIVDIYNGTTDIFNFDMTNYNDFQFIDKYHLAVLKKNELFIIDVSRLDIYITHTFDINKYSNINNIYKIIVSETYSKFVVVIDNVLYFCEFWVA